MNVQINWAGLSDETLEDRRGGKRISLQFGLEITGVDSAGAAFTAQGRTRNVSHHGCCFEVTRPLVKGEELTLKVIRLNAQGLRETTAALAFRLAWVLHEEDLWVAGADMITMEAPWGVTFPDAPAAVKI